MSNPGPELCSLVILLGGVFISHILSVESITNHRVDGSAEVSVEDLDMDMEEEGLG